MEDPSLTANADTDIARNDTVVHQGIEPNDNPTSNHKDGGAEAEAHVIPALLVDNGDDDAQQQQAPRQLDLLETIQQGSEEAVRGFLENNNHDDQVISNRHVVAATQTNNTALLRLVLTRQAAQRERARNFYFSFGARGGMTDHFAFIHPHLFLHENPVRGGYAFPDLAFPRVALQSLPLHQEEAQQQRPLIAPPLPGVFNTTVLLRALDIQPLQRRLALLRVLVQHAPQRLCVGQESSALHYVVLQSAMAVASRSRRRRRQDAVVTAAASRRTGAANDGGSSNDEDIIHAQVQQQEEDARNATLAFLLQHAGLDPNATDAQGRTPLHLAAQANFQTTAALLVLQGGANPNAVTTNKPRRLTPLHFACNYGATETAAWLVQHGGAQPNMAISMFHGLDLRQRPTCPRRMIEEWDMDPYCQTQDNETKETALHHLVSLSSTSTDNSSSGQGCDDWGVVQALLECRPALVHATNASGQTALHVASSVQYMQLLCQHGANPGVQDVRGNTALLHILQRFRGRSNDKNNSNNNNTTRTSSGKTYPTSRSQDYEMIMHLMTQMTAEQFNLPNHVEEWTALHLAAWHGHTDMVSYLLKVGRANPNVQSKQGGWTPLHVAHFPGLTVRASEPAMQRYYCMQQQQRQSTTSSPPPPNVKLTRTKTVGLLLKHGANATLADAQGNLPFCLAAREGRLADTLAMMRVAAQQGLFEQFSKRSTKN